MGIVGGNASWGDSSCCCGNSGGCCDPLDEPPNAINLDGCGCSGTLVGAPSSWSGGVTCGAVNHGANVWCNGREVDDPNYPSGVYLLFLQCDPLAGPDGKIFIATSVSCDPWSIEFTITEECATCNPGDIMTATPGP